MEIRHTDPQDQLDILYEEEKSQDILLDNQAII